MTSSRRRISRFLESAFLFFVVVTASSYAYWNFKHGGQILQPIAFNHRAHVTNAQIECSECHAHFSQSPRSGLPGADVCMACHSDALTQSPEEAKLRDLSEQRQPIVFRKLFRLPEHVYYSHRRHVVLGKLECVRCHGDIADTTVPPAKPLVRVSMDFCVQCHEQLKVTNDCKSCHR